MTGEEIARKLIEDNKYTLRACLEATGPYSADEGQWSVYHVVMDVVRLAYGFNTAEAKKYVVILVARDYVDD